MVVRHVLEAIFRRPIQLLVLLILLPVVGVIIAYSLPRSYQATATIWALHRYIIIGATGPETNLLATPADTQATAIAELLQSHEFALAVARDSNLLPSLGLDSSTLADPHLRNDALYTEISRHVLATSQGYNLLSISYSNHDPVVAQHVVEAVIKEYGMQSQSFSIDEAQRLLASYQTQLSKAKQVLDNATAVVAQYLAAHPGLVSNNIALSNDPGYAQVENQAQQAQSAYNNIQTTINTINQEVAAQGTGSQELFTVLDTPQSNTVAESRTKQYLLGGGVGLGLALLACVLYIVIMVRRDRAVYTAFELQQVAGLPVLTQLPHIELRTIPLLIEESVV